MTENKDGGPAFPQSLMSVASNPEGMSLRDWFAGQALAGLSSQCDPEGWTFWSGETRDLAIEAYKRADSMLKEREISND